MLTQYSGKPAFFYQKSPSDTDGGWTKPCYPRADYNIDMRYDPERKAAGVLTVNVWCTTESAAMPEDIEKRLAALIGGTFYRGREDTETCAVWNRSDAFVFEAPTSINKITAPEVIGVTLLFDLMEFPAQITTGSDPIQGLNSWTQANFPGAVIIAHDDAPPVWKPTDARPAVYWRFIGADADSRQTYAVNWYNGQFAAHVIAGGVTERNRWLKAIAERAQVDGEVLLTDGSPMFIKHIAIQHGADPLRDGQLILMGRYGVLTQTRKECAEPPLNHAIDTLEGDGVTWRISTKYNFIKKRR
jgi:hypothetical protein